MLTGRAAKQDNESAQDTKPFPFNSDFISGDKFRSLDRRIWISSASHAADQHGPANQFPNLICERLKNESCFVLNASRPGILIDDNVSDVEQYLGEWSPEVAVLYQSYLDIHAFARNGVPDPNMGEVEPPRLTSADIVMNAFETEKYYQAISVRNYSRNYIGSSFLLATILDQELPTEAETLFVKKLNRYIDHVKEQGVRPVLTTFVSLQGDAKTAIPWEYKTWLMRYFENMSPETIASTVEKFNRLTREVAEVRGVALIDLAVLWPSEDRPGHYDDFVHFNPAGHKKMAEIIAAELERLF